jgi:hypothetical protein
MLKKVNEFNFTSTGLLRRTPWLYISIERPPLVGEVNDNLFGEEVLRGQRGGSPTAVISVL